MSSSVSPVLSSTPNEVSCVMIPMSGRSLLLPGAAVAEVISVKEVNTAAAKHGWCIGSTVWREIELPVVSLEAFKTGEAATSEDSMHLAIINSVLGKVPFFAIQVQGVPRVMRVLSDEVHEEPDPVEDWESMNVAVNADLAVIPNLEFIEEKLSKA